MSATAEPAPISTALSGVGGDAASSRAVPSGPPAIGGNLLEALREGGLLMQSGAPGIDARGGEFERVLAGLDGLINEMVAGDGAETMRFPPVMARADFERTGYFRNFPHHAGTVHCFCGDERQHRDLLARQGRGEDWTGLQAASDLVLTPAACYPVYPLLSRRGGVPVEGWLVDVASFCFRREPSADPGRMQSFRMREHVRIGTPEQVLSFRASWMERARAMAASLGLEHDIVPANDPFFGRAATVMGGSQRERGLKFELVVPVNDMHNPTACMSFNFHTDHFGVSCGLQLPSGEAASTGCIGFGMERLTLALLRRHGTDLGRWPEPVRARLLG